MTRQHEIESKCRRYSVIYRCGGLRLEKSRRRWEESAMISAPILARLIYLHIGKFSRLPFFHLQLIMWMILEEIIRKSNAEKVVNSTNNNVWSDPGTHAHRLRKICGISRILFLSNALNVYCCTFLWCFSAESGFPPTHKYYIVMEKKDANKKKWIQCLRGLKFRYGEEIMSKCGEKSQEAVKSLQ